MWGAKNALQQKANWVLPFAGTIEEMDQKAKEMQKQWKELKQGVWDMDFKFETLKNACTESLFSELTKSFNDKGWKEEEVTKEEATA